ncbi:hypothetical protein EIP91_002320 [Steccherinum ochraceum]|uniref:F-box domain-containing protein n=1 Tax=Steccherinum ochraceum TaxID=92696 RepID=A0A4R0RG36_9APHY|nr:hypothetical protein EIP91_002320 [Steccherinum ochraceum]
MSTPSFKDIPLGSDVQDVAASWISSASSMLSSLQQAEEHEAGRNGWPRNAQGGQSLVAHLETILMSSVRVLQRIQNATRAVNTLPMDVWAEIFSHLQQCHCGGNFFLTHADTHEEDFDPNFDSVRTYMTLRSVCSYWRQVIHTYPFCFTTLVLRATKVYPSLRDRALQEIASLSDFTLLDVHAATLSGMDIIAANCHRLRSLGIMSSPPWSPSLKHALALFKHAAPRLELLDLQFEHDGWEAPSCTLPLLFSGEAPKLCRLRLRGFTSWDPNQFAGLTHLSLCGSVAGHNGTIVSIDVLLGLLHGSPNLEEFYVSNPRPWIDWSERPAETHQNKIHLDKMRRIAMHDCYPTQIAVLSSHLSLPVDAAVSLTKVHPDRPGEDDDESGEMPAIFNLHSSNYHSLRLGPPHDLIAIGEMGHLHIGTLGEMGLRWFSILAFVPDLPFLDGITELWIGGPCEVYLGRGAHWVEIFDALPHLTELHLRCKDTKTILRALATTPPDDEDLEYAPPRVLCSKLHKIWIAGDPAMSLYAAHSTYDDLLALARMRHTEGYPLRYVGIEPCVNTTGTVQGGQGDETNWEHPLVMTIMQYIEDQLELGASCPLPEVPPELNRDAHKDYWPLWDVGGHVQPDKRVSRR